MSKSDFRKFVPEMGKAFHFGLTHQQFHDLVLPARGEHERRGVEKLLSTPFKGVTTDGSIVCPKRRRRAKSSAPHAR